MDAPVLKGRAGQPDTMPEWMGENRDAEEDEKAAVLPDAGRRDLRRAVDGKHRFRGGGCPGPGGRREGYLRLPALLRNPEGLLFRFGGFGEEAGGVDRRGAENL